MPNQQNQTRLIFVLRMLIYDKKEDMKLILIIYPFRTTIDWTVEMWCRLVAAQSLSFIYIKGLMISGILSSYFIGQNQYLVDLRLEPTSNYYQMVQNSLSSRCGRSVILTDPCTSPWSHLLCTTSSANSNKVKCMFPRKTSWTKLHSHIATS